MKRSGKLILVGALIGAFVVAGITLTGTRATGRSWPALRSAAPADPTDVEAIKEVLRQSTRVDAQAALTFDPSGYRTVYVDDTSVPLTDDQANYMAKLRVAQADEPSTEALAPTDGWLTYSIATLRNIKRGAEAMERITARARAGGREVTATDYQNIPGVVDPLVPPPQRAQDSSSLLMERNLSFQEIIVDGNRALATYDDGVSLIQAFLVKTKDGWKVAGRKNLQVHG